MCMIYNMDCREGSKLLLEDDSVDLIITDPPYNLGYGGTGQRRVKQKGFGIFANDDLSNREYRRFTMEWIREAYRIIKPGRHIYVCIDWRNYPLFFWMLQHVGFTVKNCIVWDKVHMGMGWQYRFQHEFVILAVKDVAKRRLRRKNPPPEKRNHKNRRIVSRSKTDVWSVPKLSGNKMVHPTEKPIELILPMIEQSSLPGELVVDFFVGSGPVYEAAVSNGRLFTGFEVSKDHYNNAIQRVKEEPYFEQNNNDKT